MDYDVGEMLESLFGGTVPTITATTQPETAEAPTMIVAEVSAMMVGWETADVATVPDFDTLPLPGDPCPRCGSLEEWTDLLGRQRCGVCERDILEKAIAFAEQAARLREKAQRQKSAPRIAPHCVPGGMVDTLDLGQKRPLESVTGAL